ncbi:MAG: restriction endonuclease subunit S [Selenomonas sp.]|nr:restriction endonuclease subunit S [Selenomonas sp.]
MKKQLTPAEQLAKAQVPKEEQPYQLPQGWQWVRLGGICQFIGGGTPSKKNPAYWQGDIPWASIKDIKGNHLTKTIDKITKAGVENSSTQVCPAGSLIVATRIEPGKSIIADIDTAINQDLKYVITDENVQFLHWFFHSRQHWFEMQSSGSTVLGIRLKTMENTPFPLPPMEKQQRIVQRIESLFAKLDAAEVRLNAVAATFAPRKAVLLRSAIHGKLTTLQDMCKSIFDGDHMPPPKVEEGVPFLVIANVHTGKLDFSQTRYVPQSYYDKLSTTRKPEKGDVLYTLVGSYGIPVLVDTDQAFCFQRHMGLLKPDHSKVETKYLWYALQLQNVFQQATAIAKGTAQLTVPIKGFRQLHIPLPPLPEQRAIVAQLDRLLAREHQAAVAVTRARTELRRLRAAILARAFRGEL